VPPETGSRPVQGRSPGHAVSPHGSRGSAPPAATPLIAGERLPSGGAAVTGVCGTGKVELVRSIGADQVIGYTREDLARGARQLNLIVDTAGRRALAHLRRALTSGGTLVIVGGEGGRTVAWRLRPPDPPGADPVTVRAPATAPAHHQGKQPGSGRFEGTHRSRPGHPGHRQDLPAEPGPQRHPGNCRKDTSGGRSSSPYGLKGLVIFNHPYHGGTARLGYPYIANTASSARPGWCPAAWARSGGDTSRRRAAGVAARPLPAAAGPGGGRVARAPVGGADGGGMVSP